MAFLCPPAALYLVLSLISFLFMLTQNLFSPPNAYCVGTVACRTEFKALAFVAKALYIAVFTFLLNALCQNGYQGISWFLVLFPFLLMFIVIGFVMLYGGLPLFAYTDEPVHTYADMPVV